MIRAGLRCGDLFFGRSSSSARSLGHRTGPGAASCDFAFRTRVPRPPGFGLLHPRSLLVLTPKTSALATRLPRLGHGLIAASPNWGVGRAFFAIHSFDYLLNADEH
jgi:hypothetical protein